MRRRRGNNSGQQCNPTRSSHWEQSPCHNHRLSAIWNSKSDRLLARPLPRARYSGEYCRVSVLRPVARLSARPADRGLAMAKRVRTLTITPSSAGASPSCGPQHPSGASPRTDTLQPAASPDRPPTRPNWNDPDIEPQGSVTEPPRYPPYQFCTYSHTFFSMACSPPRSARRTCVDPARQNHDGQSPGAGTVRGRGASDSCTVRASGGQMNPVRARELTRVEARRSALLMGRSYLEGGKPRPFLSPRPGD